jgi:hypothetical protein
MTKKLEDLFDINPVDFVEGEEEVEVSKDIEVSKQQIRELDSTLDKIDAALPSVRDIHTSDEELDHLSKLAEDSFRDLMDLGMNVEPMRGSEIFSTASSLLGHAISAKNAKVTNKLKIIQLQIQKARLDLQARNQGDGNDPIDGESTLLDRNSILAAILDKKK